MKIKKMLITVFLINFVEIYSPVDSSTTNPTKQMIKNVPPLKLDSDKIIKLRKSLEPEEKIVKPDDEKTKRTQKIKKKCLV